MKMILQRLVNDPEKDAAKYLHYFRKQLEKNDMRLFGTITGSLPAKG